MSLLSLGCLLNFFFSVWAGLLGQEAGNAITDILFGDVNPSGRLPYTIAKSPSDYGAAVQTGGGTINYSEGLYIDYRWFDKVSALRNTFYQSHLSKCSNRLRSNQSLPDMNSDTAFRTPRSATPTSALALLHPPEALLQLDKAHHLVHGRRGRQFAYEHHDEPLPAGCTLTGSLSPSRLPTPAQSLELRYVTENCGQSLD